MRIGVTGPEEGMTGPQRAAFSHLLERLQVSELHHGVCIGADANAHQLCRRIRPSAWIVGHPGVDKDGKSPKRATWIERDLDAVFPPKPYLDRNEDIAAHDALVATPSEITEQQRSGTWATVRRGRKHGTRIILIYPDGEINDIP